MRNDQLLQLVYTLNVMYYCNGFKRYYLCHNIFDSIDIWMLWTHAIALPLYIMIQFDIGSKLVVCYYAFDEFIQMMLAYLFNSPSDWVDSRIDTNGIWWNVKMTFDAKYNCIWCNVQWYLLRVATVFGVQCNAILMCCAMLFDAMYKWYLMRGAQLTLHMLIDFNASHWHAMFGSQMSWCVCWMLSNESYWHAQCELIERPALRLFGKSYSNCIDYVVLIHKNCVDVWGLIQEQRTNCVGKFLIHSECVDLFHMFSTNGFHDSNWM